MFLKDVISKRRRLYVKTQSYNSFILFSHQFYDRYYGSYMI